MAPQREWFEKDYYAVLGVPDGDREGHHARLPQARQAVPPRREPGEQGRRGALQGGLRRVRRPRRRRRSARSTTRSARWSRRASVPGASAAGGFGRWVRAAVDVPVRRGDVGGLGDLLGGLFGGGGRRGRGAVAAAGAAAAARGADLEAELTSTSSTRCTASPLGALHRRGRVLGVPRHRREARHLARRLPAVRRLGRGRVDQGPFSFSQVCPTCGGRGSSSTTRARSARAAGVEVRRRDVKVSCRSGSRTASASRCKAAARPVATAARRATSTWW